MSLGLALNNAVSGLRLNQQALSVLSNNLANVNTEGYSRKVLSQKAVYIEGQGSGVQVDGVVRKVDAYLQRSTQTQGSETKRLTTIGDYYDRVQVLLGEPGGSNSVDEYMTTFFNSLSQVADQPERTSFRSNLVNSANALAQNVSGTAMEIESLRYEADQDISASVGTINASLKKLYDLNVSIARASGTGQSTAGMLDERDMALKAVTDEINVNIFYNPNGTVNVTAGNGVPLVDGQRHELRYSPQTSVEAMVNDTRLGEISVVSLGTDGQPIGTPSTLVSGGKIGQVSSQLTGGKLQGLVELRDKLLPDVLNQLDMMASRLRDSMNAINNDGSGFPPATVLTGNRLQNADQEYNWSGSVRIAVLNSNGSPLASPYASEGATGLRPLTLDLSKLQSSGEKGSFSVATVMNEINNQFGAPGVKTSLGGVNNIQLVSDSTQIPTGGSTHFKFDLDLENISGKSTGLFVKGITVKDSNGIDMTNVAQGAPQLTVSTTDTYTTNAGSNTVGVKLASTVGLKAGDVIYLGSPSTADVNGIPAAGLTGYFTIGAISGNTVSITASSGTANANSTVSDGSGIAARTAFQNVAPGASLRSNPLDVDLSSNISSLFYDITLNVDTVGEDGAVKTSQITYRVQNNQGGMNGLRFDSTAATGDATREAPVTTQGVMRAILVDENGQEIQKIGGVYPPGAKGSLKLIANSTSYGIAIDEMDSKQLGDLAAPTRFPASNQGFSSYFGLNNFFAANNVTEGADAVKNSAVHLRVEQRLINDPNLISSGNLVLQTDNSNTNAQYTYARYSGDNQTVQRMAQLASQVISFDSAGGLPNTQLSLQSYTSEMLGYVASLSAGAADSATNAQALYDGFSSRAKATSGVNLDEELSNTVIFQNAYAATARIVSVVDEMFKTLIDVT